MILTLFPLLRHPDSLGSLSFHNRCRLVREGCVDDDGRFGPVMSGELASNNLGLLVPSVLEQSCASPPRAIVSHDWCASSTTGYPRLLSLPTSLAFLKLCNHVRVAMNMAGIAPAN